MSSVVIFTGYNKITSPDNYNTDYNIELSLIQMVINNLNYQLQFYNCLYLIIILIIINPLRDICSYKLERKKEKNMGYKIIYYVPLGYFGQRKFYYGEWM